MGIFTFIKPFFSKSVYCVFRVKFLNVISELEDIWAVTKQIKSTQNLHLKWHLDAFTHCLMQDMNAFNLQLQMHKMCFDIKHNEYWWILIFEII